MRSPDVGGFLEHVEAHQVTHTFLPTLVYLLLTHERLDATDQSSLQCFWYSTAPMPVARLEEALVRIGPVMARASTSAPTAASRVSGWPPRATLAAGDGGRDGRPRCPAAAGRGGRDRGPELAGDGRLLPRPDRHGRGVGVGLAPHR